MKTLLSVWASLFILSQSLPSILLAQSDEKPVEPPEQTVLQPAKKDISEISLEELLNEKMTVATSKPLSLRESPAIITVFTREELARLGVRDLIDILGLVPGFSPAADSLGITGMGFRGFLAYEGGTLLLIDGHNLVERGYSDVPLGNRLSVNQIERVEIIRGPGSATYGREAELVVINIITRIGKEYDGVTGSYHSGYFSGAVARQNLDLSAGHHFSDDLYFGASIFRGYGTRSNQNFIDINGNSVSLKGTNKLDPENLLFNFRYQDLKIRFLFENYRMTTIDGYGEQLQYDLEQSFKTYSLDVANTFKLSDEISITPDFKFSRQKPWELRTNVVPTDPLYYYDFTDDRYTAELRFNYAPVENANILVGTTYDYDDARYGKYYDVAFQDGTKRLTLHNVALFSEATVKSFIANPTVGLRYEYNSAAGNSFVPRFGISKLFGDFHAKFLYNRAFRAPSVEQFKGAMNLKPEKVSVIEAETGYNLTKEMFVRANFFDITIDNKLLYQIDPDTATESYLNLGKIGTRGVESEFRFVTKRGFASLSYSFYIKTKDDSEGYYTDPLNDDRFLAFPSHKITAEGSYKIYKDLSISPSLIVSTGRSAYTSLDGDGNPVASELGSNVLFNLYFLYENLFMKGLGAGAGIFDIFNQKPVFIQAYNGSHPPLPGPSRMFVFNLSYSWEEARKSD